MDAGRRDRLLRRLSLAVLVTTIAGALACEIGRRPAKADVPPQQWWQERGPVVPHDSFPADCELCHAGGSWDAIRDDFHFDHAAETGVPLEGAHQTAECLRCHNDRGPVALFANRGCTGCHEDIHRGQLGPRCTDCHSLDDWLPDEQIVKHDQTRFPLIGAHAAAACYACHEGAQVGNFNRADIECVSCHQADLRTAKSPDHVAQGLVDDCDRCHIPTTWHDAQFDHSGFPLTGAHLAADCEACHKGGVYQPLPTACVACHESDYQSASDPDHVAAGFPTECQQCHGTASWQGASFAHSFYPLTGAHAGAACLECHVGGVFQGTPTDCQACHLDDYQGTQEPDHQAAGFPLACDQCHGTFGWEGASFSHDAWPLTGAHLSAACNECHEGGVYGGTPTDCYACHQDDYQGTNDPNHVAAGFPTSCQVCHDTSGWEGADFNHSFPINSGAHKNLDCIQCHTSPSSYQVFTCTDCHAHEKQDMDHEHHEVGGYVYSSPACYNCHPKGKGD